MDRTGDTGALAASFPFAAADPPAEDGVLYGLAGSGAPILLDRFARENYNSVLLARSGAGKSYLAKLEALRLLYRGVQVFVIDPEDEYRRLCESVGGVYLPLAGEETAALNPLDLPSGGQPHALEARGTKLVHPPLGTRSEGGVELTVWGPRYESTTGAPTAMAADPVRSVNDNSLVATVRYAGRTVLFTGDIEAEGEELLVAAGIGRVDVVKVAHHGSPTSSSQRSGWRRDW